MLVVQFEDARQGASEGVVGVDRSLEKKVATVACGWRNGDWFETWFVR